MGKLYERLSCDSIPHAGRVVAGRGGCQVGTVVDLTRPHSALVATKTANPISTSAIPHHWRFVMTRAHQNRPLLLRVIQELKFGEWTGVARTDNGDLGAAFAF
jgi:hypothetical protein